MHRNVLLLIVSYSGTTSCGSDAPSDFTENTSEMDASSVVLAEAPRAPDDGARMDVRASTPPVDGGAATRDSAVPDALESACDEPPNHVRGGNFEIEPFADCGWQTHDVLDRGIPVTRECGFDDHPSCAALLANDVWGDDWVALFYQYLTLEPGRNYEFSFDGMSVHEPRSIMVALLGAGPEGGLGNGMRVAFSHERWTTFTNRFTAAAEAAVYSELVFAIGGAEAYLYLDNIAIVPVPAASTP